MTSGEASRESKLAVLEKKLNNLFSSVSKLEKLVGEMQGAPIQPIDVKKGVEGLTVRSPLALFNELPDQLGSLADRISKATDEIRQVIY